MCRGIGAVKPSGCAVHCRLCLGSQVDFENLSA